MCVCIGESTEIHQITYMTITWVQIIGELLSKKKIRKTWKVPEITQNTSKSLVSKTYKKYKIFKIHLNRI